MKAEESEIVFLFHPVLVWLYFFLFTMESKFNQTRAPEK